MRLDHITSSCFVLSLMCIRAREPGHPWPDCQIKLCFPHQNLHIRVRTVQGKALPHSTRANRTDQRILRPHPLQAGAYLRCFTPLLSDISSVEPPDPIPNSEVKRTRADGSVAQAMQE